MLFGFLVWKNTKTPGVVEEKLDLKLEQVLVHKYKASLELPTLKGVLLTPYCLCIGMLLIRRIAPT